MKKRCASCGGTLQLGIDGGGLCAVCLLQLAADRPGDTGVATSTDILGSSADLEAPHYRTLSVLGGSPIGTTYLAEGAPPLPPLVAVKVLNRALDSALVKSLRTAVAQISAARHAALVRVHESGVTPAGAPYFARDYIRGRPLDRQCDQAHLSLQERLTLVKKILAAIADAHAVGVVHGAIKASNVLAIAERGRTEPRVLDFGVLHAMRESPDPSKDVRDLAALIRAILAAGTLKESERLRAIAVDRRLADFASEAPGLADLMDCIEQALSD